MPILTDFRIDDKHDSYVILSGHTDCVSKGADTSYFINSSYNKLSSSSEQMHPHVKRSSINLPSLNYCVFVEPNSEYHMTIAVKRGTEIGPPSEELSFITTKEYPILSVKADAKSTEVTLTIHPESDQIHFTAPYIIYKINNTNDNKIFYNKEPHITIAGLISNKEYHFVVEACYEMRSIMSCKESPVSRYDARIKTDVEAPGQVVPALSKQRSSVLFTWLYV